jgi:hypothetical protein
MNQVINVSGLSNREFLETYAHPGRIGLAGGSTLIDKAINRAQRHVDPEKVWGHWSHAFLFQGVRHDKRHWVIESDLQIHRKHIQLGVQENRVEKFYDEAMYGSLAVLDFSLSDEQVACLLSQGLELVAAKVRYSLRELVGTLFALRHPTLRSRGNRCRAPNRITAPRSCIIYFARRVWIWLPIWTKSTPRRKICGAPSLRTRRMCFTANNKNRAAQPQ